MSFLVGLIDSNRFSYLLKHPEHYTSELMYYAQQRYATKLVNNMVKHGIARIPDWQIDAYWKGTDHDRCLDESMCDGMSRMFNYL
jgi:hypothetical protein